MTQRPDMSPAWGGCNRRLVPMPRNLTKKKDKHGVSVPIGVTEFYVHAARFNFFSSTYEWLVVAGPKAQYRPGRRARSMARATTGSSSPRRTDSCRWAEAPTGSG